VPVVLQAKTGSASTQYVYSLGTRPLAEYEAAAWEYLLTDALGSVRQIADANGNVTLAKSYEPYGSVLNSSGSATSIFAYAGEQIDNTGLIYLRARYMQPRLGIFLSRDPWPGDTPRPGSMNGWNYVEGNPVNFTDPSGNIPKPDFGEDGYEYSCNCGWIDWSHAGPGNAENIIRQINDAQTGPINPYRRIVRPEAIVGPLPIGEPGGGGVEGNIVVKRDLGRDSTAVFEVSLGVYMELENLFEEYQGSGLRGFADSLIFIGPRSSFSEEDLMSDLIGFYIAAGKVRGGDEADLKRMIREKCDVVGSKDDPATRLGKQLEAWYSSYSDSQGFSEQVKEWYSPKLHCVTDCEGKPYGLPAELLEFSPIPHSYGGLWRWHSAKGRFLGHEWHYDLAELNR